MATISECYSRDQCCGGAFKREAVILYNLAMMQPTPAALTGQLNIPPHSSPKLPTTPKQI